MTKKDYILLASVIKKVRDNNWELLDLVNELSAELKKDNNNFNRPIFVNACGFGIKE